MKGFDAAALFLFKQILNNFFKFVILISTARHAKSRGLLSSCSESGDVMALVIAFCLCEAFALEGGSLLPL